VPQLMPGSEDDHGVKSIKKYLKKNLLGCKEKPDRRNNVLKAHIKRFAISVSRYKNEKIKKYFEKWYLCKEKPVKMHSYQENHTSRVFIYLFYKYKCLDCAP